MFKLKIDYKNEATITGKLGNDPIIMDITGDSKCVTHFNIAVNKSKRNKDTMEWEEDTQWFNVSVFGEYFRDKIQKRNVKKGSCVEVTGEIRTDKWEDKDGVKRETVKIIVGKNGKLSIFSIEEVNSNSDSYELPNSNKFSTREFDNFDTREFDNFDDERNPRRFDLPLPKKPYVPDPKMKRNDSYQGQYNKF